MGYKITQTKPAMKKLSEQPTLDETAVVVDCELGAWTEIGPRTSIRETVMGDYSYVVNDSEIIYSDIGKFVNIAAHTRINPGQHPMDRASMHHFQYRSSAYELGEDDPAFFDWRREKRVKLEHDVWIGHGAIVQGGVTVGIGSVVGSGAVVTKDVAPYTIVTGIPATRLRRRFEADIVDALLRIRWWDWSHHMLAENLNDFRALPVRAFCLKFDTI